MSVRQGGKRTFAAAQAVHGVRLKADIPKCVCFAVFFENGPRNSASEVKLEDRSNVIWAIYFVVFDRKVREQKLNDALYEIQHVALALRGSRRHRIHVSQRSS